jgi:hypothetical protein
MTACIVDPAFILQLVKILEGILYSINMTNEYV